MELNDGTFELNNPFDMNTYVDKVSKIQSLQNSITFANVLVVLIIMIMKPRTILGICIFMQIYL